jgi:hypothetical protein
MSCLPFEVVESLMAFTEGVRQTSNAPSHPADIASFIRSSQRFFPWCLGTSVLYFKFVGHRRGLCPCEGPELTMSLWDAQLDEGDVRRLANLARLTSMLIASKALPITVLKARLPSVSTAYTYI